MAPINKNIAIKPDIHEVIDASWEMKNHIRTHPNITIMDDTKVTNRFFNLNIDLNIILLFSGPTWVRTKDLMIMSHLL